MGETETGEMKWKRCEGEGLMTDGRCIPVGVGGADCAGCGTGVVCMGRVKYYMRGT